MYVGSGIICCCVAVHLRSLIGWCAAQILWSNNACLPLSLCSICSPLFLPLMNNQMADAEVSDTRIRVILRVRPPNAQEKAWFAKAEYHPILKPADQTPNRDRCVVQEANGKENRYDRIFRDDCKQQHIFRDSALPTLENVFKGYCGAIMAYGQTGTGKTHTMQGYDKTVEGDERGIIPRAADYIFSRSSKDPHYKTEISISMVQIYLDRLQVTAASTVSANMSVPNAVTLRVDAAVGRAILWQATLV